MSASRPDTPAPTITLRAVARSQLVRRRGAAGSRLRRRGGERATHAVVWLAASSAVLSEVVVAGIAVVLAQQGWTREEKDGLVLIARANQSSVAGGRSVRLGLNAEAALAIRVRRSSSPERRQPVCEASVRASGEDERNKLWGSRHGSLSARLSLAVDSRFRTLELARSEAGLGLKENVHLCSPKPFPLRPPLRTREPRPSRPQRTAYSTAMLTCRQRAR